MAPDLRTRTEQRLRLLWWRGRLLVQRPAVPDWPSPAPADDPRRQWQRQLDRTRATLELAREEIGRTGWVGGGWFGVDGPAGARLSSDIEAYALLRSRQVSGGACLVGTLLRLAEDPDRPTSVEDVRRSVDELHEALAESTGYASASPGRAYPLVERQAHVRALTAWNDEPGRQQCDVERLIDRAVARTIVGACG